MRIVIDLQGAQGSSRNRGIARYSLALAKGLARNRGEHEVFVALNGEFADSLAPLTAALEGCLPAENVLVWAGPEQFFGVGTRDYQRHARELFRESALASVEPDYVLITSFFEGNNAVTSIGRSRAAIPTAAVLYDLIPLIHNDFYLRDPHSKTSYTRKLDELRKADLLLAISESSRQEALTHLGMTEERAINISAATDEHFSPGAVDDETRRQLAQRYGLVRPFIMYTGGVDRRKNIDGLIRGYAAVPAAQRQPYQLAIVCRVRDRERTALIQLAAQLGLAPDDVVFTGFVPEETLLACYRACELFVFASWHEGFGLPALEAMMCGRAVIAGNRSSLPEVMGWDRALFDPLDPASIAAKIAEVLADHEFRAALERHGLEQAGKFSWDQTARLAWGALEESHARHAGAKSGERRKRG